MTKHQRYDASPKGRARRWRYNHKRLDSDAGRKPRDRREQMIAYRRHPEVRLAKQLGITVPAARSILEVTS